MTESQKVEGVRFAAESVCRQWQKILRLEDWDVEVEVVRHHDLSEGSLGAINSFPRKKHAVVRLLDPRDYNPRWKPSCDLEPEETIVHELLHIHMEPLAKRGQDHLEIAEEQAVNAISVALVRSARGYKPE